MRKIKFYKGIRSKSVAVCLSVAMAITTFTGSTPGLYTIHAEEGAEEGAYIKYVLPVEMLSTQQLEKLGEGAGVRFAFPISGASDTLLGIDNVAAKLVLEPNDNVSYNVLSEDVVCTGIEYKVVRYTSADTIENYLYKSDVEGLETAGKLVSDSIDANTSDLVSDVIAVYARPVLDDNAKQALTDKLTEENPDATFDYDTYVPYSIQKTYGYSNCADADFGFGWYNGALLNTSDLQYVETATLGPDNSSFMPNIKYQIIPYSGGEIPTPGDDWSDNKSLAGLPDGQYVGYVACTLENGTVIKQSEALIIGKDAEAPTFSATLVEIDADNNVINELGVIEDDGSDPLTKAVNNKVADGNRLALDIVAVDSGAGVKSINYNVDNGVDVQEIVDSQTLIILNNGDKTVVNVKISDSASTAHIIEKNYSIINDVKPPVIDGICINGEPYDSNDIKKLSDFDLVAKLIKDEGAAGLNTSSGKVSFYKDGDTTAEPDFVCSDMELNEAGNALEFKLSNILNGTVLKGNYKIVVSVKDNVDNEGTCEWEDIYIDTSVPACDNLTVYYREKGSDESAPWNVLGSYPYDSQNGTFSGGNVVINPYDYYEYKYEIVDLDGDIEEIAVSDLCGYGEDSDSKSVSLNKADGFTYKFFNSDNEYVDSHNERSLVFTFSNELETKKEDIEFKYTLTNKPLDVAGCRLKDSDGNVIDRFPETSNKQFTFDVNLSSSHKIKRATIKITDKDGNIVDYGTPVAITDSLCRFVPGNGTFVVDGVSLSIPSDIYTNRRFTNTYVVITEDKYNENGELVTKEIPLGTLLYDMSKPQLKAFDITLNGDSNLHFDPNKWYKSASAVYTIEAGNFISNDLESVLASVECTVDSGTSSRKALQKYNDLNTIYTGSINDIDASGTTDGTSIVFDAYDKASNRLEPNKTVIKIDGTKPEVKEISIDGANSANLYNSMPNISAKVTDNISIDKVNVTLIYPDGEAVTLPVDMASEEKVNIVKSFAIPDFSNKKALIDGDYSVIVTAYDKASNDSDDIITFKLDRTPPTVNAKISSGTSGDKTPMINFDGTGRDMYYRSDVGVTLTYKENIAGLNKVTVTDNGEAISPDWSYDAAAGTYVGSYIATTEGMHIIRISATDDAGNTATEKTISFVKDITAPTVSTSIANNYILAETGKLFFTSDVAVSTYVYDNNIDEDDFYYSVDRRAVSEAYFFPMYNRTSIRTFSFSDEADYTVSFYAVDKAGNRSETRTVDFRIDKTSPELSINGVEDGGKLAGVVSLALTIRETFFSDATGKATIYRRNADGARETVVKTIDIKPNAAVTSISETFSETGEYRIEMEASDRVGHRSTLSKRFIVDTKAPVIKLTGVKNYDKTASSVSIYSEITDDFYMGKKVSATGTRVDIDGKRHILDLSGFNANINPTIIDKKFDEDGIYDIDITSVDAVGNSSTSKVHFTIDKTKPEIGDLPIKDGAYVNKVDLDFDVEDLVKDLTVCNVSMYLNGSEYDGALELEDGVYKLLITAVDELGHKSEKTVSFVLDTKAPLFVVEGVADGDVKDEDYNIKVGVQDDDDILSSVTLDGVALEVKNNTVSVTVKDKGKHELTMAAKDKAGNEGKQTINFKYGEKTVVDVVEEATKDAKGFPFVILLIILLLLSGFFFIILKRKKEKEE